MKVRALLICLAIAGCTEVAIAPTDAAVDEIQAPPPPPFSPRRPESADPLDPCFAGSYLDLIGRDESRIGIAETPTFRLIRPDSLVTEEFAPTRVNAVVDPSGMIISVYCG